MFLGRLTLVGKVLSFTNKLSFFLSFLLSQFSVLNSHTVDGHRMYLGGSVVGIASTTGREI